MSKQGQPALLEVIGDSAKEVALSARVVVSPA